MLTTPKTEQHSLEVETLEKKPDLISRCYSYGGREWRALSCEADSLIVTGSIGTAFTSLIFITTSFITKNPAVFYTGLGCALTSTCLLGTMAMRILFHSNPRIDEQLNLIRVS